MAEVTDLKAAKAARDRTLVARAQAREDAALDAIADGLLSIEERLKEISAHLEVVNLARGVHNGAAAYSFNRLYFHTLDLWHNLGERWTSVEADYVRMKKIAWYVETATEWDQEAHGYRWSAKNDRWEYADPNL